MTINRIDDDWVIVHPVYGYLYIEHKGVKIRQLNSWGQDEETIQYLLHINGVNTFILNTFETCNKFVVLQSMNVLDYHSKIIGELHREIFPEKYV